MGLFDKIKDVIGDIAPVVLPVAINAFLPGLGTVASGALGAGIGTLLQGGDAKDALKSAALGGGIGALKVGMTGSQGSFGKNISADIRQTGTFLSDPLNPSFRSTLVGGTQKPFDYQETVQKVSQASAPVDEKGYLLEPAGPRIDVETKLTNPDLRNSGLTSLGEPERGFFKGPFQKTFTDPELTNTVEFKELVNKGLSPDKALASLQNSYNPTFMDKYGLLAAGGIGALMLSDDEEEDDELSPLDEYDSDQFRVNIGTAPIPTMDDIKIPYVRPFEDGGAAVPNKYKGFSKLPEGVQQKISPELAKKYAAGGEVDYFPRRTGGIGPGEGSGTKDDVPAMLMDGEFVMTRNAVKAAGGGSVNKGIDNMYSLMRNLEARA